VDPLPSLPPLASTHLLPDQIYLDAAMIVNVIAGGNRPEKLVPLTPP
jgi:hypothetical protein